MKKRKKQKKKYEYFESLCKPYYNQFMNNMNYMNNNNNYYSQPFYVNNIYQNQQFKYPIGFNSNNYDLNENNMTNIQYNNQLLNKKPTPLKSSANKYIPKSMREYNNELISSLNKDALEYIGRNELLRKEEEERKKMKEKENEKIDKQRSIKESEKEEAKKEEKNNKENDENNNENGKSREEESKRREEEENK